MLTFKPTFSLLKDYNSLNSLFLLCNAHHVQLMSCPLHWGMWKFEAQGSGMKAGILGILTVMSNKLWHRHHLTSAAIHGSVEV